MITRRRVLITAAGTGLSVALLPAHIALAHRETVSHSEIFWNAASNSLDVTHQFHIHEAETAMAKAGMIEKPDLTRLRARARLALYVETTFSLTSELGNSIALDLIGAEIERQSVYVYQSAALDSVPQSLILDCHMFRDLVPNFINRVDIKIGDMLRSVEFKDADGPKKVLA